MLRRYDIGNGIKLAVEESGTVAATPLILLHGGGGDSSTWAGIAPAFAASHQVFAVDLRGFGATTRGGPYGFAAMRDDVIAFLDFMRFPRVDLVGHSMGGTVAWLVAETVQDRVSHLVVEDSPPPARRPGAVPVVLGPRPDDCAFDWAAMAAVVRELNDPDPAWWDSIGAVTAPTLLLAGGPSSHVPQELFASVLERLGMGPGPGPGPGRLAEIPVGHHIHRDAPSAFLDAVVPFLQETR